MTLYEIDEQLRLALEAAVQIDPDTGEVLSMDMSQVEELQLQREEKLTNVALAIKNLTSDLKQIKEEKDRLSKRQASIEKRIQGMTDWLRLGLNGERISDHRVTVSYRKSVAVDIPDESVIGAKWLRIKREPDKTAIKQGLKEGKKIRGASLVERISMVIK